MERPLNKYLVVGTISLVIDDVDEPGQTELKCAIDAFGPAEAAASFGCMVTMELFEVMEAEYGHVPPFGLRFDSIEVLDTHSAEELETVDVEAGVREYRVTCRGTPVSGLNDLSPLEPSVVVVLASSPEEAAEEALRRCRFVDATTNRLTGLDVVVEYDVPTVEAA